MNMNDEQLYMLADLQAFLTGTVAIDFMVAADERYEFIAHSVRRSSYGMNRTKGKGRAAQTEGQKSNGAASAVNSKGGFWYATYKGGLTGELFVELLGKLMYWRCQFRPAEGWMRIAYPWCKKPLHLIVPAHKKKCVKEYVASLKGRL